MEKNNETNHMGVVINITGGNNQVLPNAVKAEQTFNFYGDKYVDTARKVVDNNGEVRPLSPYIKDAKVLEHYLQKLSDCQTAKEVGLVVLEMVFDVNVNVDQYIMVKHAFIIHVIRAAVNVKTGRSESNFRTYINEAWSKKNDKKTRL
jgi:hypothetical protein